MSSHKFEARTLVTVTTKYPDPEFHGRQGLLVDYSDDRKPRAIVVFFDAKGEFDTTRFLFDSELEAAA